jgi:hypothetical protein
MAGEPLATNGLLLMATDKRIGDRLNRASAPDGELHDPVPHLVAFSCSQRHRVALAANDCCLHRPYS